jgi:hypothetical protein
MKELRIFPDDKYQMDLLADYLANEKGWSRVTANRLARRLVNDGWNLKNFTKAEKAYGEVVGYGKGVRKFAPLVKKGYKKYYIRCRSHSKWQRIEEYYFVK